MVDDCLPSSPRVFRITSPSRISVNWLSRSAPSTTPPTMATTTSAMMTAMMPRGSTVVFMTSAARSGTNWENRNQITSAAAKISGIVLLVMVASSMSGVVRTAMTSGPPFIDSVCRQAR